MSSLDDNSFPPDQPAQDSAPAVIEPAETLPPAASAEESLSGDPISLAASRHCPHPAYPTKIDLENSLNLGLYWLHFFVFAIFSFVSLFVVQFALLRHYLPFRTILTNQKAVERTFFTKPLVSIGTMVILYALIFLFLYVTLGVLRGAPFWRSLGWKKIGLDSHWPKSPWLYFGAGALLSLVIAFATNAVQPPKDAPIEELLNNKNTALFFMAMAVLIAPLVEETVFRGYLYPLLARSFGAAASIILTGTFFGLLHGMQLGWSRGIVLALIAVGIIFTFVRARTGSVLASFLLHLGYNSTLALFAVVGTEVAGRMSHH